MSFLSMWQGVVFSDQGYCDHTLPACMISATCLNRLSMSILLSSDFPLITILLVLVLFEFSRRCQVHFSYPSVPLRYLSVSDH